eukprot:9055307-Pyramimonas_sp.AAC.1
MWESSGVWPCIVLLGRHRTTWWYSGSSPSLRRVSSLGGGILVVAHSTSPGVKSESSNICLHLRIWATTASFLCSGASMCKASLVSTSPPPQRTTTEGGDTVL